MGYIYKHTNKINGKVYIGLTKTSLNSRWQNGNGYKHCRLFYRAILKYGWNNFEHELIEEVDASILEEREKYWIAFYKSNNENFGYNLTSGGEQNKNLSKSTRLLQSKKQKERAMKEGYINPFYKKKHSKESKNKMSNRQLTEDQKEIQRRIHLGKKHSEETKRKIKSNCHNNKKINQYDIKGVFIKVWSSIGEAAEFYSVDRSGISKVCSGKQKSAAGFIWKYVEED